MNQRDLKQRLKLLFDRIYVPNIGDTVLFIETNPSNEVISKPFKFKSIYLSYNKASSPCCKIIDRVNNIPFGVHNDPEFENFMNAKYLVRALIIEKAIKRYNKKIYEV